MKRIVPGQKIWWRLEALLLVVRETRQLFKRRWLPYAALAAALIAGSAYAVDAAASHPDSNGSVGAASSPTQAGTTPKLKVSQHESIGQNAGTSEPAGGPQTNTQVHASLQTDGRASTDVTVNGQPVAVPQNGSVHQDITSDQGNTSVDISHTSTGSTSDSASTSIQLNVDSYSQDSSSDGST